MGKVTSSAASTLAESVKVGFCSRSDPITENSAQVKWSLG